MAPLLSKQHAVVGIDSPCINLAPLQHSLEVIIYARDWGELCDYTSLRPRPLFLSHA